MKTIYIVTGATGFLGSIIVKQLCEAGKTVHAYVRSEAKAKQIFEQNDVRIFCGDIRNSLQLEKAFDTSDAKYILIHAAAIISIGGSKKSLVEMQDVNIGGTKAVIECSKKFKARLVYVSSVHAIPELKNKQLMSEVDEFNPKLVKGGYAKAKTIASALVDSAIKQDGLDAVIVHPSGITGPGDFSGGFLTQMVSDFLKGKIPAAVRGGYDFVDVRDVAQATIKAADCAKAGSKYLLTNRFCSVREILDTLSQLTGKKKPALTLPIFLAYLGLPFISFFSFITKSRPLYTAYSLYTLTSNSNFSHQKATAELDFLPRPIKDSLADTISFLQSSNAK